ncbi:hypothetical protein [Kitasatospora sp. NPDC088783]|uniref:hypothetical protein n=1 Tax=Kitasatospora sp. NPDC088783 TaxID=3364077 RepID=UPI0038043C2C
MSVDTARPHTDDPDTPDPAPAVPEQPAARYEAELDHSPEPEPEDEPPALDLELTAPDEAPEEDFDPAFDLRPLGSGFRPEVRDPDGAFLPKELAIAELLAERGARVDARPADHGAEGKNPDTVVRKGPDEPGVVTEFKTVTGNQNALKQEIRLGSKQVAEADGEVVVDVRESSITREEADRAYRRAAGQRSDDPEKPATRIAKAVHIILGDDEIVSYERRS